MIETDNEYIKHLESLKNKRDFIPIVEKFIYGGNKVYDVLDYFYVFQFKKKYIGVVESTNPKLPTLLYSYPDKLIKYFTHEYIHHLENPAIYRNPDPWYLKEVAKVNKLIAFKCEKQKEDDDYDEIFDEDYSDLYDRLYGDPDNDTVEDKVSNLLDSVYTPIKCRTYFIGEVPHSNLDEWRCDLEKMIEDYLENNTKHFQRLIDSADSSSILSILVLNDIFSDIVEPILYTMEKEYKDYNNLSNATQSKKGNITKDEYNPLLLVDKSIYDIASILDVLPQVLYNEIKEKHSFNINNPHDTLNSKQISLCRNIFERYWLKNK